MDRKGFKVWTPDRFSELGDTDYLLVSADSLARRLPH
jgi:hypothetical protein